VVAADRTRCYLPLPSESGASKGGAADPDASMRRSGVLPTDAVAINESSTGSDHDWRKYLAVWRAHHDDPGSVAVRRLLTLPQDDEVQMTIRRGRVSPKFLPWRAASFTVIQTPHFEILSRANETDSKNVARDLERLYWVWTQMYFPLWAGHAQIAVALADWNPESFPIDEHLARNAASRLSVRQRHRVVLLPDERTYQLTIALPGISAGGSATIDASTGFYSDTLSTSFFFPQSDRAGLAHETCHQLFEEAIDQDARVQNASNRNSRRLPSRTSTINAASAATDEFWLVEGIAGHFESVQFGARLATIGGWDSTRLQYARYQNVIARQPIATIDSLRGNRREVQRRGDLASWYRHAITHTHQAIDANESRDHRAALFRLLAEIYRVDVSDFTSLGPSDAESFTQDTRIDGFLRVDDAHLLAHPITGAASAICLAGCNVSIDGWASLPPLTRIKWFDASRTPITDDHVVRLLGDASRLEQLSLEATRITPEIRGVIGRAIQLRELDLSWTAIDDSVIESLADCQSLETTWLTGTPITDAALNTLLGLKKLSTLDVQRTRISDTGLQRIGARHSQIELNPLQLPD